jgi:SAM-dependent methyltransferase
MKQKWFGKSCSPFDISYFQAVPNYYETEQTVRAYIQMAQGYNGRALIEILRQFLPDGKLVLELGMGPGKDLLILQEFYNATGSDFYPLFLEMFRKEHPEIETLALNAIELNTHLSFDGIWSNKVLHHLTPEELKVSLKRQSEILNPGGVVAHSFWKGSKRETLEGLLFQYYMEHQLVELFAEDFEPQVHALYSEMDRDDSIFIIARKKD